MIPNSRTKGSSPRRLMSLVLVAILGASLWGCAAEPERNASGEIAEEGDLSVFRFQIGDCFDDPENLSDEISDVAAVPCSSEHDNEVYHLFDMPEGAWPGDDAIDQAFADTCLPAFEAYVGTSYELSEFYIYPITPTEQSWDQDDREVVCVLYDETGPMVGSAKDTQR